MSTRPFSQMEPQIRMLKRSNVYGSVPNYAKANAYSARAHQRNTEKHKVFVLRIVINKHMFHSSCLLICRPPFGRTYSAGCSLVSDFLKTWCFRIFVRSWGVRHFRYFTLMFLSVSLLFSSAQLASNTSISSDCKYVIWCWFSVFL